MQIEFLRTTEKNCGLRFIWVSSLRRSIKSHFPAPLVNLDPQGCSAKHTEFKQNSRQAAHTLGRFVAQCDMTVGAGVPLCPRSHHAVPFHRSCAWTRCDRPTRPRLRREKVRGHAGPAGCGGERGNPCPPLCRCMASRAWRCGCGPAGAEPGGGGRGRTLGDGEGGRPGQNAAGGAARAVPRHTRCSGAAGPHTRRSRTRGQLRPFPLVPFSTSYSQALPGAHPPSVTN